MDSVYPDIFEETIYGLDFGYNNPSALLEINYKDNHRYLKELLYGTKLTNTDLIEQLKMLIPVEKRMNPIYADCAEPARIQEISESGFNVIPADKSVKDGIDFCRSKKYHTLPENINLNKERSMYKNKQDKDGKCIDEPVAFMNHLMDCKRYADYTHNKNRSTGIGIL